MRERHSESRDYACKEEDCGKTFKRGSHLKRHMISHTSLKTHKCGHCCMSFGYKHHLDRHIKVIHLSERIECTSCGLKFKKKKAFHKHVDKLHTLKNANLKKGLSVEDSKIADNTITKIGMEESMKHEDIYVDSSDSEEDDCARSEKLFYRCHYDACLSAFERLSDFKRHLSHLHADDHEE